MSADTGFGSDKPINEYSSEEKYDDRYNRLFAKVLMCQVGFQRQDLDEIVKISDEDLLDDNFGSNLDIAANRDKVPTIGYSEPIYKFIESCADMREIDGVKYYNVFGQWEKIIIANNSNY